MICGLDEAGRGPVIGPLVVAAVMVDDEGPLRAMGVADSKLLTRRRREELDLLIRDIATVQTVMISANDIDTFLKDSTLNLLEVRYFAALIDRLRPERVYIDAADVVEDRFGARIRELLSCRPDMVCQHRADQNYPVVSAASVVAKVARDRAMDELEASIGRPIGSGYAHDEITRAFIRDWLKETGSLPPQIRTSWKTAKDMVSLSKMSRLTDWTD